jgi:hypothetical protein
MEQPQLSLKHLIYEKRHEIRDIAAKHGAYNVRLFGSVVRGEAGPTSDIDLLVDVGPITSAWFPAGLVLDLEALLGRPVEIVTERALRPDLRSYVLQDATPL